MTTIIENKPLRFSIITVCRNAAKHIEGAVQSVLSQTYPHIEYIIIDGASTDETLSILEKYRSRIAKIISEKDDGIYDAMNKGLGIATGDILYFLNSDDRLYDSTVIAKVARVFTEQAEIDICYGKVIFDHIPEKMKFTVNKTAFEYRRGSDFVIRSNPQQCFFIQRQAFLEIGPFQKKYKVCGDYDWFLRSWRRRLKMKYIDDYVAFYSMEGLSYHIRYHVILERIRVVWQNSPPQYFIFYLFYASIRKIRDILIEECWNPSLRILLKLRDLFLFKAKP